MVRNIAAAVAGLLVALAAIQAVESLGHIVYPPPTGMDFGDPDQLRAILESMPVGAILFIGGAWACGAFAGTLAGALIATAKPLPYAIVVGGIVLAGALTMLIVIPHPWWFTISAPVTVVFGAWLGMYIAPLLYRRQAGRE